MSKQLTLDSFLGKKETKKRTYIVDTTTTTKNEPKKRKSTIRTKENKDIPFWWKDKYKNFLKVENKIDKNEENGEISWTKQYISKSNWKSPINFDEKNLKQKEKKEVVHKTSLSKKVLKEDEILRSRKILLRPTSEQKEIIQQWMRITRFVYNITCRYVKKNKIKSPNFKKLKAILLNKEKNPDSSKYAWLFDKKLKKCPRDAKDSAIQEFVSAVHSSKEMLKEKQKKSKKEINLNPKMKERSQNDKFQRIIIPKSGGNPSVKWTYDEKSEGNGFKVWPNFIGNIKKT